MARRADNKEDTLAPLTANVRLLGGMLGDTITTFEGKRIFDKVEALRRLSQKSRLGDKTAPRAIEQELAGLSHAEKYKVAKAFTEFLRLANLCEQVHRIRRRNDYRRLGKDAQRASPYDTFERLRARGLPEKTIREAMRDVQIELVLTAHPTEAMRPQAVRAYRDLSIALLKLDHDTLAPYERDVVMRDVASLITQLWLSGAVRERKPTPVDEARYGLEVAERILWRAIPDFHHLMSAAYKEVVGDMAGVYPRPIRFGSWMGGDRDGHPGVTADITRKVLREASNAATAKYLIALKNLRENFAFDKDGESAELHDYCLSQIAKAERRLREFRRTLSGLTRNELLSILYDMQDYLHKNKAGALAGVPLQELIWRIRVFGLCFLKLDIRQSSDRHAAAVEEILGTAYAKADEAKKITLLEKAIRATKFRLPKKLSADTAEVIDTLRVYNEFPGEFFGPYIISMAETVSDLLGVQFLMKAAGVKANIPISPLFETPASLKSAVNTMAALYNSRVYRKHAGAEQQIMVGYSDSSKRGGYLAAAWEIYGLQTSLLAIGKKHGLQTTFFHGRGGSVARGGGPIETALLALPRPMETKRIRITEQGEVIDSKFGLPGVAERTMELYLSGFLDAVLSKPQPRHAAWDKAMQRIADVSEKAFRKTIYETPEFMDHFQQLTPAPELGLLKIGSRPGRRKKGGGLDSMRAIPWVFGWTQSRTMLPAWLGVGDALNAEIAAGNLEQLREMYAEWPFFQAVTDLVEMVVAKADAEITRYYSQLLVEPRLQYLTEEYLHRLQSTGEMLRKVTARDDLLEKSPVLARSIRIRTPYVDVLNILQAHLLKEYRSLKNPPKELRKTLALTIGGISAGMRNTG
ncbi:MAG TPA: phosphoenolpyruvate carboxylase [Patescibacteria group bacterium]|nr:phosphoenolpyruvate carboxylase [Patescibacteria group bacterium]